ncbi:MAG: UvrD-helicase domain-containing protein [Bacteroidales bacterium]|nr:UvrD-helicase domain-containing protein [Bacteroidales bacterium]
MQDKALTIYKASAGSGKTFTLSATYIAHLLSDEDETPHRHQLAVTFTNKATAEMKERILQYLYSIAFDNDPEDGFFKEVRKNVPERITDNMLRSKARRELFSIIHDYDHFHVTTIDSFFQSLLSALAHELNLSASFKAEVSDKEVLAKAVDRLLENLKEGSDELNWITEFIKERMNEDKDWNIADELKHLASQITKEGYMLNSHLLNRGEGTEASDAITLDNATLQAYKKKLRELRNSEFEEILAKATALNKSIEQGLKYENITAGSKNVAPFINRCLALKDSRKRSMKGLSPTATIRGHADGSKHLLTKANQKHADLCAEADALVPLFDALVTQLDKSSCIINSCELSLANLNPLRLLDTIDREVHDLNRENDRMLLAYTPLLFHNLAENNDASFVFERAGTRFNHVMIDEFQDTSRLQWDNMRQLLVENMAQGNSCMLVGDVKQGIYRFRGGDWNALAGFAEGYSKDVHSYINIKTLKMNFRSGREVVEFNNDLFSRAASVIQTYIENSWSKSGAISGELSPTLDAERIYTTPDKENDNHEVTQLPHDEGGYVRIHLINNSADAKKTSKDKNAGEAPEAEAFNREAAVAEQMLQLHSIGVPYSEMAILIRDNKDAKPLIDYFEEHHGEGSKCPISLMSEEAFYLNSSSAVLTLVNALRYVSNTSEQIALEYLRRHCPVGKDFDDIKKCLDKWNAEHYCGMPIYELSCRLADLFSLHTLKGQSPYVYCFLDSILSYLDDHSADVKGFLKYWDDVLNRKTIPSASAEGVRILTIHKSKGLAFHTVFIPYCDWPLSKSNKPELIWTRPTVAPFNDIPILPVTMTAEAGDSIYRDIYRQEVFDKHIENLNLLYVAFTRTKQNLLVWADCKKSGIAPILRDCLDTTDEFIERGDPSILKIEKTDTATESYEATDDVHEQETTPEDTAPKNPLQYIPKPILIDFSVNTPDVKVLQSSTAQDFIFPLLKSHEADAQSTDTAPLTEEEKAAREEYRKTGILLHRLMSTIESTADVDKQIEEASRNGLLPRSLSTKRVSSLINKRINHPTAREWFDGSWRLYRECSIIYTKDGKSTTCRPDRVMMRGNMADGTDETIVIDFKFGRPHEEHEGQVQDYMKRLTELGSHNVRGYVWYLYSGEITPVPQPDVTKSKS